MNVEVITIPQKKEEEEVNNNDCYTCCIYVFLSLFNVFPGKKKNKLITAIPETIILRSDDFP